MTRSYAGDVDIQQSFQGNQGYWRVVCRNDLIRFCRQRFVSAPANATSLDIGCEMGQANVEAGVETLTRADLHLPNLEMCRSLGAQRLVNCRGEALPLATASHDLVYCSDVLEHIRDDLAAMQEIARVLKPGGYLLATVPAFGVLWSAHDEALHHCRRYSRLELSDKLKAAGFQIERLSCALFFLFFPAVVVRFIENFTKRGTAPATSRPATPGWLNALLIRWHRLETALMHYVSWPVGISIVVVARKPGV